MHFFQVYFAIIILKIAFCIAIDTDLSIFNDINKFYSQKNTSIQTSDNLSSHVCIVKNENNSFLELNQNAQIFENSQNDESEMPIHNIDSYEAKLDKIEVYETQQRSNDKCFYNILGSIVCSQRNVLENMKNNETEFYRECCHGYGPSQWNDSQCSEKLNLGNLLETINQSFNYFYQLIKNDEELMQALNYTNLTVYIPSQTDVEKISENAHKKEILRQHISYGLSRQSSFKPNKILSSFNANNESSKSLAKLILTPFYKPNLEKIWKINCVPIDLFDISDSNGIIHVLNATIKYTFEKSSLQNLVELQNYSLMTKYLISAGVLKNETDQAFYTIFAVDDDFFKIMEVDLLNKLENGDECALNVIRHNVISGLICPTENFAANINYYGLDGTVIHVEKYNISSVGKSIIDTANGFIYRVNRLEYPLKYHSLVSRLRLDQEADSFINLIARNNKSILEKMENLKNITLFIPTAKAMKEFLNKENQNNLNNSQMLEEFTLNHIVKNIEYDNMSDYNSETTIKTMSSNQLTITQRKEEKINLSNIDLSDGHHLIQCGRIHRYHGRFCGGHFYYIDTVLTPKQKNTTDVLSKISIVSYFSKMFEIVLPKLKLNPQSMYTMYVPKNGPTLSSQFAKSRAKMRLLNITASTEFVKKHIYPGYRCCSKHSKEPQVLSLIDSLLYDSNKTGIHEGEKDKYSGNSRFGAAYRVQCNLQTSNRILIHIISRALIQNHTYLYASPKSS